MAEGFDDRDNLLFHSRSDMDIPEQQGASPLIPASQAENVDCMKALLDNDAAIKATDSSDLTPLHHAAKYGHKNCMTMLLGKGADANLLDANLMTPLLLATDYGQQSSVSTLIKYGADVNITGPKNKTAAHFACQRGHSNILSILLESGVDVNARDIKGSTPILVGSFFGNTSCVELLLKHDADITATGELDQTSVHWAAQENHVDCLAVLIKHGAGIETRDSEGSTPLHIASYYGSENCLELLLHHGANVDVIGELDQTPLHWAAQRGYINCVSLLLNKNACVNCTDIDGYTPLHLTSLSGHTNIVQLLISNGANVNAVSKYVDTALTIAIKEGHEKVVDCLLKKDARVNDADDCKITPLHHAALSGQVDIVLALIRYNADVNAVDIMLKTPLHIASEHGYRDISSVLLTAGANPSQVDKDGKTAYDQTLLGRTTESGQVDGEDKTASHKAPSKSYSEFMNMDIINNTRRDRDSYTTEDKTISRATNEERCCIYNRCQENATAAPLIVRVVSSPVQNVAEIEEYSSTQTDNAENSATTIVIGRLKNGKMDDSTTDVAYNLCNFLTRYRHECQHQSYLEEFTHTLDKKVTILRSDPSFEYIFQDVQSIAKKSCEALQRKYPQAQRIYLVETGSSFTNLKVGLPLEADFLLVIVSADDTHYDSNEFCEKISSVVEAKDFLNDKSLNTTWLLHGTKRNRVGVCLIMQCRMTNSDSEIIGVTVDLIPAKKSTLGCSNKLQYSKKFEKYLQSLNMVNESQSDIYTLLSESRDCQYDTGVLVNKLFTHLDEDLLRGFRVAKYLLQNDVISRVPQYREFLNTSESKKLYGYEPLIKSFHLRLCFLQLLLDIHDTELSTQITPGSIVLCLLDMTHHLLTRFGEFSVHAEAAKSTVYNCISIPDPILQNETIEYKYKLQWAGRNYLYRARQVLDAINTFKNSASAKDSSRYSLMNYYE